MNMTLFKSLRMLAVTLLCSMFTPLYAADGETSNSGKWEIDFSALAQKYANWTGITISDAVYDNVGTCSIVDGVLRVPAEDGSTTASEEFDHRFALQSGTNWLLSTDNSKTGLYQSNGGYRTFGVLDVKKDQIITIEVTEVPSIKSGDVELFSLADGTYTYYVNADCNVVFNLARYNFISKISVENFYGAEYTVKFVNEKGEKVKDDVKHKGYVNKPVELWPNDIAHIDIEGGRLVFKEANNTETNVVKEDGSTVITVVFREAEKYYAVLQCMAGSTLLERFNDADRYWFYEDDALTIYPSRGYMKDGVAYFTPSNNNLDSNGNPRFNGVEFTFPGSLAPTTIGGKTYYIGTLNYEKDETVVYYSDVERLALPTEDAGNGTGLGQLVGTVNSWYSFSGVSFDRFSGGRGIRLDVGSYVWTEPIAKTGTYKVTIYGRNDTSNAAEPPYVLGLRDGEGNVTWFEGLTYTSWGGGVTGDNSVENVKIPAGSSLVVKNDDAAKQVSLDDIKIIKLSSSEPVTTYTLSIEATGNGFASYNGTTIRSKTTIFTVDEGTSATVTFSPDAGYRFASVIVNGADVTSSVVNNQYTISNITANTTLAVTFEAIPVTIVLLSEAKLNHLQSMKGHRQR